ncbi:TonB-dependent receptor domain-containing protein [Steroidobacter sp.]|uniref:TonB-dependent receptor domain-containing protein n=1 Tax=Steroidobacter sp. TaxID=1978227 RepID=UPI001A381A82|nr:TonB-dependent receptor [Steroidobacter sp.]MBL8266664.1 TonB-dependent receptor [Steroidobacter sp.]
MRTLVASAVACFTLAGLSHADSAEAAIRKQISIQPQDLATALNSLARARELYVIYADEDVIAQRTRGVFGQLTQDEALKELLGGTGLTYRYIDEKTVTILPVTAAKLAPGAPVIAAPGATYTTGGQGSSAVGGDQTAARASEPRSFWSRIRLAQAGVQGAKPTADLRETQTEQLEEVVVTAQKREQRLMDVPISISALGSEEIEALRVQGFEDFAMTVPNMTFTNFGRYYGSDISLRGLTTFTGGLFQSTSVTVDEAGYGATDTASILSARFLDIQRIEVLRGPQGTLSGRNSMGGSINIITVKPNTETTELTGTVDIGRFDTRLFKLAGNLPLGDTVGLRASLYKEDSEGAIKNVAAGNSSSSDNFGGSLAMRWTPTERFTMDLSFGKEKQDYGMNNFIGVDLFNTAFGRQFYNARFAEWGGNYADGSIDFIDRVGGNGGRVRRDTPESVFIENQIASARLTYTMDKHTVSLLGGQHEYSAHQTFDYDRSEYALYRNYSAKSQRGTTAELRVTSSYDGPVNWVGGVSYLEEKRRSGLSDEAGVWIQQGSPFFPPYVIPTLGTQNAGWRPVYVDDFRRGIESRSAYGNVFWDITDSWHLSAGSRVTRDETSFSQETAWDAITFQPRLTGNFETYSGAKEQFSHRLALTHDFTAETKAYVQWSTGYRPGYANTNPPVLYAGAPKVVDPERVVNYEIGLKGSLFDRRASYALAVFQMDYDKLQVSTQVPNLNPQNWLDDFFYFDINSGAATIKGVEFESSVLVTDHLELRGAAGYNDGKIERVTLGGVTYRDVDIPGRRKFTANASGIYTRPVTSSLQGQLRVDYNYQGERVDALRPVADNLNPSFKTVNLSAGVFADQWSLTAYFENVLDEVYWHDVFVGNYPYRGAQAAFDPRMYGVRFVYHFAGK